MRDSDLEEFPLDEDILTEEVEESLAQAEQTYASSQAVKSVQQPQSNNHNPHQQQQQQQKPQPNNKRQKLSHEPQSSRTGTGTGGLGENNRKIGRGEERSESFGVGNGGSSLLEEEEESMNNRQQFNYHEGEGRYVQANDSSHQRTTVAGPSNQKQRSNVINGASSLAPPPIPRDETVIRKNGKLAHPVPSKKNGLGGAKGSYSDDEGDDWWTQTDLNMVEEEAVRNSQQQQQQANLNGSKVVKGNRNGTGTGTGRNQSPALNQQQSSKQQHQTRNTTLTSNSNIRNRAAQQRSISGGSVGNGRGLGNGRAGNGQTEDEKDRELREMREEVEKVSSG